MNHFKPLETLSLATGDIVFLAEKTLFRVSDQN